MTNHTVPALLEVRNYFLSFVTHYFLSNFLKKKKKSTFSALVNTHSKSLLFWKR